MVIFIYLSLFSVIGLAFFEERLLKYRKTLFVIIAIALMAIATFRPIGCDKDSPYYEYLFDIITDFDNYGIIEISYTVITLVVKMLSGSLTVLFAIFALIGISTKLFCIYQYSKLKFLPILLYLSNYYILHDLTQIRAGIASGIFLCSLYFLAKGERLKFVGMLLFSTLFHYSTLLLFPLVFLNNKEISPRKRIFLASLVAIGYLIYFSGFNFITSLPIPYIEEKFEVYQKLNDKGILGESINVFNIQFLLRVVIYWVLLLYYDIISPKSKYFPIMLKIMGISVFFFLACSSLPVLAFRGSELYGIVDIFMYANLYYIFKPSFISKIIISVLALITMSINIFYVGLLTF